MKLTKKTILSVLMLSASSMIMSANVSAETIRVVTDPTFPPMEFVKDGVRQGFDIDITEALAKSAGMDVEWTDIDFKGLVPAVLAGRADAANSAIYITPDRAKVVDFTDSYYAGGLVVLTKKDGPIKSLKDLDGKNVSVQVGTKSVGFMHDNYPKTNLTEVEKNEEMFTLVSVGRVDAAVTGKPAAKLFAQAHPELTVLDEQITTEEYGIAVDKKQPELLQKLNQALKDIKADGSYQQIVNKWFESTDK